MLACRRCSLPLAPSVFSIETERVEIKEVPSVSKINHVRVRVNVRQLRRFPPRNYSREVMWALFSASTRGKWAQKRNRTKCIGSISYRWRPRRARRARNFKNRVKSWQHGMRRTQGSRRRLSSVRARKRHAMSIVISRHHDAMLSGSLPISFGSHRESRSRRSK